MVSRFFPLEHTLKKATKSSFVLDLLLILLGTGLGFVVARLIVKGDWQIALALIFLLPGVIILHRYPFLAVIAWLLLEPFLLHTYTAPERQVYWIIHRGLPPLTISILVLSSALRINQRKLPRLGLPELLMAGYVAISLISINLQNNDPVATTYTFYDRVFSPMCLYLIVRLSTPDENQLRWLLPVAFFISLSQSTIGLVSWSVPHILPSKWLDKAGSRTTGSLVNTSVFTTTITFTGLLLLHTALNLKQGPVRRLLIFVFLLTTFSIFMSFSRASWLAGMLVTLGLLFIYPRFMFKLVTLVVPFILVFGSVLLFNEMEWARQRLFSRQAERSAISRIPVYYAAYRMFQEKPIFGWGYGNFNLYDRRFQGRVFDFPVYSKDHSSHNTYLTIIAEQGMIGLVLYIGPLLYWLFLSIKSFPKLPKGGFGDRNNLLILWLVILAHIVVNNFSDMSVVFGLGMWWITLGLIANIIVAHRFPGNARTCERKSAAGLDTSTSGYL